MSEQSSPLLQRRNSWLYESVPHSNEEQFCNICHNEIDQNVSALFHKSHGHHKECMKPWLARDSSCGLCRAKVSFIQPEMGEAIPIEQRRQAIGEDYADAVNPVFPEEGEQLIIEPPQEGEQLIEGNQIEGAGEFQPFDEDIEGMPDNQGIAEPAVVNRQPRQRVSFLEQVLRPARAVMRMECIPLPIRAVLAFFAAVYTLISVFMLAVIAVPISLIGFLLRRLFNFFRNIIGQVHDQIRLRQN